MGFFLLQVSSLSFERIARREGASEEANPGETGRSNAKACGKAPRSWPAWDRNNSLGDPQKHHFISLISLIISPQTNKQTKQVYALLARSLASRLSQELFLYQHFFGWLMKKPNLPKAWLLSC